MLHDIIQRREKTGTASTRPEMRTRQTLLRGLVLHSTPRSRLRRMATSISSTSLTRPPFGRRRGRGEWCEQTLQQTCSQAYPGSARCVQRFDDSRDSAIRITYRISLRSSSLWEPRHPLLKVVFSLTCGRHPSFLAGGGGTRSNQKRNVVPL